MRDVFDSFARSWKDVEKPKPLEVEASLPKLSPLHGLAIFSGLGLIGMSIGAAIGTYVFFGTVTLVGLMALIEGNPKLKWLARHSSRGIDIIIFGATIYATSTLGITVSAALTFAGLGYTLIYSPFLRNGSMK